MRERLKWWIATQVDRLRGQCWADLVSWVLDSKSVRDPGIRAALPWRPVSEICRKDADMNGRCYCGKLGSDGTALGEGDSVCVTPMPGRPLDRLCSRPHGHDGLHRCGDVEWGAS